MKKLALFLGSLLVVTASVSAKEVVAPAVEASKEVVVAPIVVVEEVPAWRPSGYADLSYKFYGQDEYDTPEFGRLQFQGRLNFTPQQNLEWRVRNYNSFQDFDETVDKKVSDFSDLRLRYHYKNGTLGDTKVSLTQRVEYRNYEGQGSRLGIIEDSEGNPLPAFTYGNNKQYLKYMPMFEFSPYFDWTPDWFKNTGFTLAPNYAYVWSNNNDEYSNVLGLDIYTTFDMPYGFSSEFNFYPAYIDENGSGSSWAFDIEAYLYWGYDILKDGPWTLSANFEGGLDPWSTAGKKFKNLGDEKSYSAYMLPNVQVDYQATDFVKVYANVGAEYRNWDHESSKSARNWAWMPQATVGVKATF
ncbi:FomA family porin-like outer membrane protein [Cetobacterium somerae]|uniref:FomA family porin-like outer membrane protein n=1 Tax=Cetobacterium somerae TaxID=188913 RepID=UPI003D766968